MSCHKCKNKIITEQWNKKKYQLIIYQVRQCYYICATDICKSLFLLTDLQRFWRVIIYTKNAKVALQAEVTLTDFGFLAPKDFLIIWLSNILALSVRRLFQKRVVCTKFWYLRFIYKKQINMEVDEMLISLENRYLLVYYSDKYVQSLRNTDKVYNYI